MVVWHSALKAKNNMTPPSEPEMKMVSLVSPLSGLLTKRRGVVEGAILIRPQRDPSPFAARAPSCVRLQSRPVCCADHHFAIAAVASFLTLAISGRGPFRIQSRRCEKTQRTHMTCGHNNPLVVAR